MPKIDIEGSSKFPNNLGIFGKNPCLVVVVADDVVVLELLIVR